MTYSFKITADISAKDEGDTIRPGDSLYEDGKVYSSRDEAYSAGQHVLTGLDGGRAFRLALESSSIVIERTLQPYWDLHPRHGLVQDTHLDIAETLEGNLRVWLAAMHPKASSKVLQMYAEEIVEQSFDAIRDLAQDIDADPEEED
jgi:hypothetical protein